LFAAWNVFPDFPLPFPKGAPLGGLVSSTAAPHWADLDVVNALVDAASTAAALHRADLECVGVEDGETSATAVPHWAALYGVDDDVEDM